MRSALLLTMTAFTSLFGCGSGQSVSVPKETSHLRILVALHSASTNAQQRPPADEEQFKEFVSQRVSNSLERYKIESPDDLFASERDGLPFVVYYGKRPNGLNPEVVAHEQVGIDGVRWVGFKLGNIEQADEARFRELVPESVGSE